jgi:CHAT domain-containing protein
LYRRRENRDSQSSNQRVNRAITSGKNLIILEKSEASEGSENRRRGFPFLSFSIASAILFFLFLIPLQDTRSANSQAEYNEGRQLFLHGQLEKCQQYADERYKRFQIYDPEWAAKFRLLEARAMLYRGLYGDTLAALADYHPHASTSDDRVQELTTEGISFAHLHRFPAAIQALAKAENLCAQHTVESCGEVFGALGILATERGRLSAARQLFLESLSFAQTHHNRDLESNARLNLGTVSLQDNHYDEAVDWSQAAYTASISLGNENRAQIALGNLGWAYFELGDFERAIALFREAEQESIKLGNIRDQLKWIITAGYVDQGSGDFPHAMSSYNEALALARQITSKEDIVDSLEDLAHLSIATGKLDEASAYLAQLTPLVRATENRLDDLDVLLAQGEIAAARNQDQQADGAFRTVDVDPASQISMRLGAEHELAKLYERRGDRVAANRMYETTLTTFEQARQKLQHEDSKLPFLANATPIYDDYVHMLVQEGKVQEALAVADHSRARALAQGLGLTISAQPATLHPSDIARKADATLLFYWLGRTQSYLWAVTSKKTVVIPLPAQTAIKPVVERYRRALLGPDDVLATLNPDGTSLYQMLIEPVKDLIPSGSNVVILSDGVLSQLNFETLIVPSPHPHYWIEDATLVSAPSLYMLASAKPFTRTTRNALLLGDALSPNPDYPELPKAAVEMRRIEKHFAANEQTVFVRQRANPATYMSSDPEQYAYIHFVAHGVASLTNPLDSAIILSRANPGDDSFKLYAREIIQHPIHARLVTISSCYGGGTRSYAGEGLVGLSWAFLRAGAHNVIGALWDVSDDSTPALMDTLYQGLEEGLPPSAALRRAKLAMLHDQRNFRNPFFWAPFQIYTGI